MSAAPARQAGITRAPNDRLNQPVHYMGEMMTQHLWEIDHPYYCSEGNYFVPGTRWHEVHADYSSWADFLDEWGGNDNDLNLLFRWDWQRSDPSDYGEGEDIPGDQLHLFYMMQRKARNMSVYVAVTESDEAAVREWLTDKASHMRKLWEPLLGEVV